MSSNDNWNGPGAVALPPPAEEHGHLLEPEYKRVPVGTDHILYPVLVSLALFPILMGSAGHHLADDLPEDETHPFFPQHFWPYPVIIVAMMLTVGLLSAYVQQNMQLEQPADPRASGVIPRPDWYFLFLFQFLKLGPEFIMSLVIPPLAVLVLLLWPFLDAQLGPIAARRLGWLTWPVPGRNRITGTAWILALALIAFLELWGLAGWTLPWFSGPVTGG